MSEHRRFLVLAAAALDFELSAAEHDELARHLAACPACARTAAAMRADARVLASLPTRALAVERAPVVLSVALGRRASVNPLRLVALVALIALAGFALLTVGSELLRRPPILQGPTSSPRSSPAVARSPRPLAWVAAAPLTVPRQGHTATVLSDGRVLVAGGLGPGNLPSSELFDPATGEWSPASDMNDARSGHVAVLLQDGRALVAGGYDSDGPIAGVEVFAGDAWIRAPSLLDARGGRFGVVELRDGAVLVVGGNGAGAFLDSAELLVLETGEVRFTDSPLSSPRLGHTTTLLADGRVLVVGGAGDEGSPLSSAEIFDATTGAWLRAAPLAAARREHSATLLPDGRVLVTGGVGIDGRLATVEIYDPVTDTWSPGPEMAEPRELHSAIAFAGQVLVLGGFGRNGVVGTSALFDPIAMAWTQGPSLRRPQYEIPVVRLQDGSVMAIAGAGGDGSMNSDVEILPDPGP
jgi:anti-sigma factor RsiW